MIKDISKGVAVATAVFALLSSNALGSDKMEKEKAGAKGVQCSGINSCKGKGSCHGAGNACAGQNACKGEGMTKVKTEKECTDKGGKVVAAK